MFAQGIRLPQIYICIPTCDFEEQCFLKVTQRLRPHIHSQSHQGPLGKNPLKSIKLRTVQWLPWFPQITILKYEDLASQPSEELAAIEEKFNISLTSKEVNTLIRSCDGGVITFGKDNGGKCLCRQFDPNMFQTRKFLFDHSSSSANWEATNDYRSG